jgi:asparagine synthase (glutamine-hydrolysing)
MCGFAGVIRTGAAQTPAELRSAAVSMAAAIHPRGPDDGGAWIDEAAGVALGFRRLAVIDVSEAGHQPMTSHDGRLVIAFNGEIYNHHDLRAEVSARHPAAWRGHSDTETLLACFVAWGVRKTLERSVGMFALALWDTAERRLYLARDRFGEKPLYYGWTAQAMLFGSELAALRRYPGFVGQVDPDVLALYAQYMAVPAPYSIYRHIYKLEPGCLLELPSAGAASVPTSAPFAPTRDGHLVIERYWSLADVAARGAADVITDEHDALERLEVLLSDAVRRQSIADVPLGAFLSGGVDSSAIVALMTAQSARKVKTFTIGFAESAFNEAEHAEAVARHLGTEHEELYVTPQQARDVIPALPQLYSEPFADSSQIPTHLVSRIARAHVTVALSGDGGDELFGGYTRHMWVPKLWERMRLLPGPVRRAAGGLIQAVPGSAWDALGRAVPTHSRVGRLGDKAHKLAHRLTRASSADDLYRILLTAWPDGMAIVKQARPLDTRLARAVAGAAPADPAHRMMLWDALTYLPDDVLHKVDRASMGVSLETRAPFLDHRVAEFAWRLPLHMKIRNGTGKWILRQLLYRRVPRTLIERPKMGFGVPIDAWLRGPLRDWAEDLLDERKLQAQGYFAPAPIRRTWAEHLSGRRNRHSELWTVLMFQAWQESAIR